MKEIYHIAIAICLTAFVSLAHAAESKPNVIFIISDDQAYETIGAYGHIDIDTPNLDRLVKAGTSFSHTYNMGSYKPAVCVASRTSLNTGAFIWQSKAALASALKGKRKFWGQLMADAGYETYMAGKWHVEFPIEDAFKHTANVRKGMPRTSKDVYKRPYDENNPEKGWQSWDTNLKGYWEGGTHWSEVVANDGIGFIEEAAQSDRPFFMYLGFNAPHDPRQAPKEYLDRYPLERIKLPDNFLPKYPDMGKGGVPLVRDETLAPMPRTEYSVKINMREYFALITHMDAQIGRILDALEASGKQDNTWIVFTSDHGLAIGHHGLLGKQNMYEHSLRPPFIVVGPGVEAGAVIDAPIYLQDAMPTILELSGQTIPENVNYKSVLPLLDGRSVSSYDHIYAAYTTTQRTIIQDGWKLIVYPKLKKYKLFDLTKDPQEMTDLAQNPEYASKLEAYKELLAVAMKELRDPIAR